MKSQNAVIPQVSFRIQSNTRLKVSNQIKSHDEKSTNDELVHDHKFHNS